MSAPLICRRRSSISSPATDGNDAQFEVRAFIPSRASEDPVTGSLNAGLAQWLIGKGLAPDAYVASQGTALGRAGTDALAQAIGVLADQEAVPQR